MTSEPDWKQDFSDLDREYLAGRQLSSKEARDLLETIRRGPDNVLLQFRLLGYYSENPGPRGSPDDTEARVKNLISCISGTPHYWVLRYCDPDIRSYEFDHPYARINAYARVAKCWMDAVSRHPEDPDVAMNAAAFFRFHRPRTSVELLLRALPKQDVSVYYLKHLCWAYQSLTDLDSRVAPEGLSQIQAVLDSGSVSENWVKLSVSLAELAVDCGDLDAAKKYLEYFSQNEDEKGVYDINSLRHKAHVLRGEVALSEGDSQMAVKELLLAADVPDSPDLQIAGPSMRLARDLLRAGEKDVVLDYLERWKGRWDGPTSFLLAKWEDEIRRGEEPDFDPNVRY